MPACAKKYTEAELKARCKKNKLPTTYQRVVKKNGRVVHAKNSRKSVAALVRGCGAPNKKCKTYAKSASKSATKSAPKSATKSAATSELNKMTKDELVVIAVRLGARTTYAKRTESKQKKGTFYAKDAPKTKVDLITGIKAKGYVAECAGSGGSGGSGSSSAPYTQQKLVQDSKRVVDNAEKLAKSAAPCDRAKADAAVTEIKSNFTKLLSVVPCKAKAKVQVPCPVPAATPHMPPLTGPMFESQTVQPGVHVPPLSGFKTESRSVQSRAIPHGVHVPPLL